MRKSLSVVIPAHKPIYLKEVLSNLVCNYAYNQHSIEIIVVENPDLTDETKKTIFDIEHRHNAKIELISSDIGANKARNAGIKFAQGEIIGLLDDDCIPCREWMNAMIGVHVLYPNMGVAGGCMKLVFRDTKPRWLEGGFLSALAHVDYGIDTFELLETNQKYSGIIVSGNMSFKKHIYNQTTGFDETLGYIGKDSLMAYDEILFINECMNIGHPKRMYVGNAIVFHQIPPQRMTMDYFLKKTYGDGFQFARLVVQEKSNANKKYEDLVMEYVLPTWNALLTHNELTFLRSQMCHEESVRIYIANMLRCKIEFLKGFTEYLDKVKTAHHKTDFIEILNTSGL